MCISKLTLAHFRARARAHLWAFCVFCYMWFVFGYIDVYLVTFVMSLVVFRVCLVTFVVCLVIFGVYMYLLGALQGLHRIYHMHNRTLPLHFAKY